MAELTERSLDNITAEQAFEFLTEILEFGDTEMAVEWGDIVYYTAKAKASLKLSNAAIRRRMTLLRDVLGLPDDTGWPKILAKVEELAERE
jgi:hypothetical protein